MHLSVYMAQAGLTDDDFAELIGVARVTVSRWRRQLIRPAPLTIVAIRRLTGGKVAGDDWDQTDPQPGRQKTPLARKQKYVAAARKGARIRKILAQQNPARRKRAANRANEKRSQPPA